MDLHRLRIFLAAADELSFRRAAVVVGVGQPAVSRQVAALEDELGVTLFERRSTGACLTEAGRVFLADARRIIAVRRMISGDVLKVRNGLVWVMPQRNETARHPINADFF